MVARYRVGRHGELAMSACPQLAAVARQTGWDWISGMCGCLPLALRAERRGDSVGVLLEQRMVWCQAAANVADVRPLRAMRQFCLQCCGQLAVVVAAFQ